MLTAKVLVCGGRDYTDKAKVRATLDEVHSRTPITLLIAGGATGADTLAEEWARHESVPCKVFPADWKRWRNAAGPIRNEQMLTVGKPDMVIAFPGGAGTADMIRRAENAKVLVVRVTKGQ